MAEKQFGRYQIKKELGRGGMATVYHAHDPRFRRDVAVKVLPRAFLHDPMFRARFEREARAIAALEHPAIVPVYDFGEQDEQPYLVMRYMAGGSLADRLVQRGRLSLAEVAQLFSRLAPALDEAHVWGMIHRDLKPGNILFDARGAAYLSDFGIVKLSQASAAFTGTAIVGTPAYMSPEQARGEADIDGRSDIYSLGAILFEALTGRLPYEADTPMGLAMKHIVEPVPRILETDPTLPPETDEIIARAMAKAREERYPTAAALAGAVEAVAPAPAAQEVLSAETVVDEEPEIEGQALPARPELEPTERDPATVTGLELEEAGVEAPPAAEPQDILVRPTELEPVVEEEVAEPQAEVEPGAPRRRVPLWAVAVGALVIGGCILSGVLGLGANFMNSVLEATATPTLEPTRAPTRAPTATPTPVALTVQNAGQIEEVARFGLSDIHDIALSPDGETLAVAGSERIWLYDAATFELIRELSGHTGAIWSIAWAPDSRRLASGGDDETVRLWDAATGSELHTLEGHDRLVIAVAWSPEGDRVASGSYDSTLRIWAADTGLELSSLDHPSNLYSIAWSPLGDRVATGSFERADLWDVTTGQVSQTLEQDSRIFWDLSWSPDGTQLAVADGSLRIRDAATGAEIHAASGAGSVLDVAWSPDGSKLALSSPDDYLSVEIWDTATWERIVRLPVHEGPIVGVTWAPDSARLISAGGDGLIRAWHVSGTALGRLDEFSPSVLGLAWSPSGDGLAYGGGTRSVSLLDWRSGEVAQSVLAGQGFVSVIQWPWASDTFITWSRDDGIQIWDPAGGQLVDSLEGLANSSFSVFAFSPDGTELAITEDAEGTVQIIDVASRTERLSFSGHTDRVRSLTWSPDGQRLASGDEADIVRIWDAATGQELRVLEGHTSWVDSLSWSPDGSRLASGSLDSTVRLWDTGSGEQLALLEGHAERVGTLDWSPNGELLASGSSDATVRIWDPARGVALQVLTAHADTITAVAFSPDGDVLASGSSDGTLRIWGLP